jgi:hypothetical protein
MELNWRGPHGTQALSDSELAIISSLARQREEQGAFVSRWPKARHSSCTNTWQSEINTSLIIQFIPHRRDFRHFEDQFITAIDFSNLHAQNAGL